MMILALYTFISWAWECQVVLKRMVAPKRQNTSKPDMVASLASPLIPGRQQKYVKLCEFQASQATTDAEIKSQ